jgi:nicotinate-nucleotide adenylyltransferase
MEELGIMGGTFNPIRTRELMVALCAKQQHRLMKVLMIANGTPPHKHNDLLDREWRFEMVSASVRDSNDLEASRLEIDRPGVTWTLDTFDELRRQYGPGVRFNFIIGEDNIKSLQAYDRRAEFLQRCRLLVAPRDSVRPNMLAEWRQALPEADIEMIDCPADSSSSTLVRQWIRAGLSVRYLVPPAVWDILIARGHYLLPDSPRPSFTVRFAARMRMWFGAPMSKLRAILDR